MKKEIRGGNAHDFISENYANILLCDYSLMRDKEFEFLVNVYLKKIRLKKPPPYQKFYCRVCNIILQDIVQHTIKHAQL